MLGTMDLRIPDYGKRAGGEQAAQVSIAALGDAAEPLLAAARILLRNQADPGIKVASRSKSSRIGNARDQRRSQRRSHAGDLIKPFARLIGSMPGQDAPIELQDLCLEHPQLRAKGGKTLTCDLWHPLVIRIGDDVEELLDTVAANRRDDPELGEMGADRIDHRGLLPNEEMTCAMEHEAALLRGRLGFHEAHARTQDGLADGLGIGGIVLLALEIGLHVGRRHQSNSVAECLQLARPMVGRSASLDPNQARWQLLEEWQNISALQLPANDHFAVRIHPVNLKNRLGDVETDRCDRVHAWLLRIVVTSKATTPVALTCRWRSRPQHHVRTHAVQHAFPGLQQRIEAARMRLGRRDPAAERRREILEGRPGDRLAFSAEYS